MTSGTISPFGNNGKDKDIWRVSRLLNHASLAATKKYLKGLSGNRNLTGEHSYWWVVIGKVYRTAYEKGGKALSDTGLPVTDPDCFEYRGQEAGQGGSM